MLTSQAHMAYAQNLGLERVKIAEAGCSCPEDLRRPVPQLAQIKLWSLHLAGIVPRTIWDGNAAEMTG